MIFDRNVPVTANWQLRVCLFPVFSCSCRQKNCAGCCR